MKLKDALENYYTYSGKTSDIIRQLGLAGIAIVWLFHKSTADTLVIPGALLIPLKLIVVALAFDLLQYAISAILWSFYHRRKELSGTKKDTDFKAPKQINWPAIFFFYAKVALIVAAYWYIFSYLSVVIQENA